MPQNYYDPWGKVGENATNALAQYFMSKPNPQQQAAYQMEQSLRQAQLDQYGMKSRQMQAEMDRDAANVDYQRRLWEAQAQNSAASAAANRAQAAKYGLEGRQIQGRMDASKNMADIFGNIINQPAPDPNFVGPTQPVDVNAQYNKNLPALLQNAMQYAAGDPKNLGDIFLAFASNMGASPQQINNAQLGAGIAYDKTKEGIGQSPFTLSPGSVRYSGEGEEIASAPFKPQSRTGGFTTTLPDGTTINYDGMGPTKTVANDLQKQQISSAKMRNLLNYTRDLANKDPGNFGFPGFVKGVVQDATALTGGIAQTMGYNDPMQAVSEVQREVASSGIDPSLLSGVFDPNLPALETATDLLVFQAASALAGQSGRSVSDRDVKTFRQIVGNPRDVFSNQDKFLSKLNTIENILQMNENVTNTSLGGNVTGPAAGTKTLPDVGSTIADESTGTQYRYMGGDPNDQGNWEPVR